MLDCTLPVETAQTLSPKRFFEEYVKPNRPTVIAGLAKQWPAVHRWSPDYFRKLCADAPVEVEVQHQRDARSFYAARELQKMSFGEFLDKASSKEPKHYLAQSRFLSEVPQLLSDLVLDDVARYQPTSRVKLPPLRKPKSEPVFWFGPEGSISPLHFDRADNLFVQLMGRKRWILFAPEERHALHADEHILCEINGSKRCMNGFSPVDAEHPDLTLYPRFRQARAMAVTLEAGDALYIPPRWWHHVAGLEVNISISNWWDWRNVRWAHVPIIARAITCQAHRYVRCLVSG